MGVRDRVREEHIADHSFDTVVRLRGAQRLCKSSGGCIVVLREIACSMELASTWLSAWYSRG